MTFGYNGFTFGYKVHGRVWVSSDPTRLLQRYQSRRRARLKSFATRSDLSHH